MIANISKLPPQHQDIVFRIVIKVCFTSKFYLLTTFDIDNAVFHYLLFTTCITDD